MGKYKEIAYFKVTRKRHGGKYGDITVYNALKENGKFIVVDPLRKTVRHNTSLGSDGMVVEVSDKDTFDKYYKEVTQREER